MAGKNKIEYEDIKLSTRTVLIGLWTALIRLYIYCDIFTFLGPIIQMKQLKVL
jgi:hypothetical protein